MTNAQKSALKLNLAAAILFATTFVMNGQTRPDSLPPGSAPTGIPGSSSTPDAQSESPVGGLPADGTSEFVLHPAMKGVRVEMDERNELFMKVDNPITIKVSGAPAQEIYCRMQGEGAVIEKMTEDQYKVQANQPGLVILEVVRKTDTAEVVIGGRAMAVTPLPRPAAQFAGKYSGSITKKEVIKEGKTLSAHFNKLPFELSAPVESFLLTIVLPEKAGTPTWKVKGATIPEAAQKGLKDAPVGSVLFFDEIMVKMPGENAPKMITGLVLRITE